MFNLSKATLYDLRVNNIICPIGIDTLNPIFSWKMASKNIGAAQTAYRIIVTSEKGEEVWNTNWVYSDKSVAIPYGGAALSSSTKYLVRVSVKDKKGEEAISSEAFFETALLEPDAFDDTKWISFNKAGENGSNNLPVFRKKIMVKGDLKNAKLYTSGLGVYESYINGNRVCNKRADGSMDYDVLKPGYTEALLRRYYNTYDITHMLSAGNFNVISGIITPCWWSVKEGFFKMGEVPAYFAKIILNYADGTKDVINTNADWKTAKLAPVQADTSIYNSERYDATVSTDWMLPDYDDSFWVAPVINKEFGGRPIAQAGAFVKIRDDLEQSPKSLLVYDGAIGVKDGFYGKINIVATYLDGQDIVLNAGQRLLVDFGQNFAGFEYFEITSERGTAINIYHAEMLNDGNGALSRGNDGPEGSIYRANYRSAESVTKYITAGGKNEGWHPLFSFNGFRYIEITVSKTVTFHRIRGRVVTSVLEDTAGMTTSNADVNRLINNVKWGMYGNYLSVPTDCPQRDERLGWLGDTQVFAKTGLFLGNNKNFLEKFMLDIRDNQFLNPECENYGAYTSISPAGHHIGAVGAFGWADCGIIVPYYIYMMSGDTAIIKEMWQSMRLYMDEFLKDKPYGPKMIFGDWLSYEINSEIGNRMLGTCFHALDARMMAKMAKAIGENDVAEHYEKVYNNKKTLFNSDFQNADGTLKEATQSVCLYALYTDMVDDTEPVINQLISNIERNGNKLQTGFLGTAVLMPTLTKIGRTDVAYKLLLQHENPSWLYSVDQGATTIWERWNSYTLADGFGDVSMNSFNHYAYGAVLGWMYSDIAGIDYDPNDPGFKAIILSPKADLSLPEVNAFYVSPYGKIISNIKRNGKSWNYNITIPANTTATVILPVNKINSLKVNGKSVKEIVKDKDGIEYLYFKNGKATFSALAGEFRFVVE